MNIYPLFSSPLYVNTTTIPSIPTTTYHRSEQDNGWISDNQQILNDHDDLNELVDHHIAQYLHTTLQIQQSFHITNSWINKHTKGDYLPPHSHANSLYTGILYLKVPPNSGNVLTFSTPPSTIQPTYNETNIYNATTFSVELTTGTILIFPSYLEHSAPQSNSTEERLALSFNIFLHGQFGTSTNLLSL